MMLSHAKVLKDAIENQQLLYDCIRPNSIMLKPSKTRIGYSSTKFLGDIYTSEGRLPDPSRVESILKMNKRPKNLKEVRHIVGLLVWNIEFIPNGMGLLSYLTDLMRKDVDIVASWKDEIHGKAIDQLKAALSSAPCLKPIDVTRPFRVHVDACKNGRGMGAVLLQEYNERWRPCSYFSRALTPAQRQRSATELEAHALVSAARHWERYLQNGHMWMAIVDHKALIYLVVKRTKTNNARLLNSVMYLQSHYFGILHRSGEEHFDADAVSRILHSGDIDEALEAADWPEDNDKEVTVKDLRNLHRLLKLRMTQLEQIKANIGPNTEKEAEVTEQIEIAVAHMAQVEEALRDKGSHMENNDEELPELMDLDDDEDSDENHSGNEIEHQTHTPTVIMTDNTIASTLPGEDHINQTNMVQAESISEGEEEGTPTPSLRDRGIREAQQAAERMRKELTERRQEQDLIQGNSSSSSSNSTRNNTHRSDNTDSEGLRTNENGVNTENENAEEEINGGSQFDALQVERPSTGKKILLQTGPYRWTPATMTEYIQQYLPLEGKLWVHPRTRRLYEITNVFFYEKYKLGTQEYVTEDNLILLTSTHIE